MCATGSGAEEAQEGGGAAPPWSNSARFPFRGDTMRAAAWDGGGLIWIQSKQQRKKKPRSYSFPWSKALRPAAPSSGGGGRAGRDGTVANKLCVFFRRL